MRLKRLMLKKDHFCRTKNRNKRCRRDDWIRYPPYVEHYCASRTNLSVEAKLRLQFKAGGLCVVIRVDDVLFLLTSKPICVFNLVRIFLIFLWIRMSPTSRVTGNSITTWPSSRPHLFDIFSFPPQRQSRRPHLGCSCFVFRVSPEVMIIIAVGKQDVATVA